MKASKFLKDRGIKDNGVNSALMEQYAKEKAEEVIQKYTHCQSCGKPLSRDCPRCERLWES